MAALRRLLARGPATLVADLREDRRLRLLLLVAALLCGFYFWHRVPNFATRDEWGRLLDPLVALGHVLVDPSPGALREGVAWGRVPFGATFYLFGLALVPVVGVAALTGRLAAFERFAVPDPEFGYYPLWANTPEWVWTGALLGLRLVMVLLAVLAVYLTYRVGRTGWNRTVGHLSGLVLALTFGFLTLAHEAGEDVPALVCLLAALYLLVRFVQDGGRWRFLAASVAGGAAIAFKLTAAPVVALVALAHLLRARRARDPVAATLRPGLVVPGATLGAATILAGFPTLLVGRLDLVLARLVSNPVARATQQTGPDAPVWWWFLRGYASGLGLPLLVASTAGVVATLLFLRRRRHDPTVLVLAGVVLWVGLFAGWHDFRVHHLLPTFPLLALLLAGALVRFHDRRPEVARPVAAALLLTTGLYAGVGVGGYAAMPRDEAEQWLRTNADENATVEVYRRHFQDTAVPHGTRVNHLFGYEVGDERVDPCPAYIQLGYRDLLYLRSDTYYRNGPTQREYLRGLLAEGFQYRIVAEFGTHPPEFVPRRATPGDPLDLLRYGLVPQTDQYADEQELAANQYTLLLARNGSCSATRRPPF